MTNNPILSVIVCFKDWGLERLEGVTRSILMSGLGDQLEIIIADYGSADNTGYAERLGALGARYFYYETDGIWSRSRALNLGLKEARGKYFVTTDADMVFTPSTFPRLVQILEDDPNASYILQCRDLPQGIEHDQILTGAVGWDVLEAVSRFRPRWGMGGLIAFTREAYEEVRGLDERLEIYGGEDLDFAKRLVRAGHKRVWIEDPKVGMYHVWHPSSRALANTTEAGKAAIQRNSSIHQYDKTVARNLNSWSGRPDSVQPLVTVAISTYNRAGYIEESIASVKAQSFHDWELVIVNDGSTDNTRDILDSIEDQRVRVYHRENEGLAAQRNFITSVARGKYIAVHDDDDIMLPNRLETQLEAITEGFNGAYGGWINFGDQDGTLEFCPGKKFSLESMLFNSGVYLHPTLMVEKRIMESIPYNRTMRSGSDYNLAVRMARAGVKLTHSGQYLMLRRMHEKQITNSHGDLQKVSGRVTGFYGRALMSGYDIRVTRENRADKDHVELASAHAIEYRIVPYLPDHLVGDRAVSIAIGPDNRDAALSAVRGLGRDSEWSTYYAGENRYDYVMLERVSQLELFRLHENLPANVHLEINVGDASVDTEDATVHQENNRKDLVLSRAIGRLPKGLFLVVDEFQNGGEFERFGWNRLLEFNMRGRDGSVVAERVVLGNPNRVGEEAVYADLSAMGLSIADSLNVQIIVKD